jgi:hypothetical protein
MSRKNGGIIGPANTPVGGLIPGVAGGVWRMNDVLNFVSNNQWPTTPQNIENSCRFETNTYLTRTLSSANTKTFTFSFWIKRSFLGAVPTGSNQFPIGTYQDANNRISLALLSDNTFILYGAVGGSAKLNLTTNRVYRDTSAWMHFVCAVDTTQSTASDRAKIYINGVEETSFSTSTYPDQDQELIINTNVYLGTYDLTNNYYHGYLAEVVYVDGQALTPSTFAETNTATGIWTPKKISHIANAGSNTFYLDFKDSSNLGNDASGLSNDLTSTNLTSLDQTADTCVENFATINPLVRNKSYNDGSLAEGNTYFAPNGRAISCSTIGVTKGKWYAEFKAQDAGALYIGCGQLRGIDALSDGGLSNPIWYDNNPGYAVGYGAGGSLEDGTGSTSYGSGYSDNNIVGVALDMDNYEMYISVNGTFQNSGDPTSGSSKTGGVTGATSYNPFDDGEPIFFFVSDFSAAGVGQCYHNYGNPAFSISSGNSDANGFGNFEYSVPSGYYALNTSNLNTYG